MKLHRRRFLAACGIVAGAGLSGRPIRRAAGAVSGGTAEGARTYRACIIGSTGKGNYGHSLDTCFQNLPGVVVEAVADPDEKGRAEAARRSGARRSYADWREMLRAEKPDLLAIGPRWVVDRLEMITAAADVGASVFMEKPLAASLEEADAMVAVAEKHGIKVVLAHQARQAPAVLHLQERIAEGLIGELLEVRTRGKEDHRAGGEDLMVLGTHCLYLMRAFAGEPSWCSARVLQDGREIAVADRREGTEPLGLIAGNCIHATYAFPRGVQGHFASQSVPRGEGGRFQVVLLGSRGMVQFAVDQDPRMYYLADPLWSPGSTGKQWLPVPDSPTNRDPTGLVKEEAANKRIVESLIRWMEGGVEPPVSIREGRATLEMILAVYAAHLKGCRVSFPLAERKHPLA